MRSRRPTPCSPAIVFRLSINSPRRIVTPLMPTAAPRSNSISTCAGFTGASSRRRVILNSDSSGLPRSIVAAAADGPAPEVVVDAIGRRGLSPPSAMKPVFLRARDFLQRRIERRNRLREPAPIAADRAVGHLRRVFDARRSSTSVFAISGRVSAVAIGYRVSERAPALSDGSTMSRANSSRASITCARAAPADSACVRGSRSCRPTARGRA